MSLPANSLAPPAPPRIRSLDAGGLPLRVEPMALLNCIEGDLVVRAAEETLHVSGGELLVLRSGAPLELDQAGGQQRLVLFEAPPAWVDAFWALHGADPEATRRTEELERVAAGTALARRAAQLLTCAQPGKRLSASTVASVLELAFQAQGSLSARRHPRRQQADRGRALIRALADFDPEVDGDFSLHGLAEHLGLSSRQTARLVRGETGRSFRELKTAARIERARKLLASSELSILEVALRAGWNSASQFHEAFRQSVGVTPARYRAAHHG